MNDGKLFKRDFTLVVIGQIISLFGNAILRFALPLYLLKTTGSAALFGIVSATSFLPMIVLSLLGGVLADRVNKRNIMVILDISTAFLILVFNLLLGNVPIVPLFIVILMILYGIQGAYQPAVQASIPALVDEKHIVSGNAVINQISSLAGLLGPIIGGFLYGFWGIRIILAVSIVCFVFSAIMEIFIHIPFKKRETNQKILTIVASDLKESFSYIRTDQPIFFKIAGLIAFINLALSAMIIIGIPVIMLDNLGVSEKLFGISQGILAMGGLGGGIASAVLGSRLQITKAHLLLFGSCISTIPMGLVLFLNLPVMVSFAIISAMSFLCVAFSTMFTIQLMAVVQLQTPQILIGKVISCLMAIAMCAQPIGQAIYGLLFEQFENDPWIVIFAAAILSCLITAASTSMFRNFKLKKRLGL